MPEPFSDLGFLHMFCYSPALLITWLIGMKVDGIDASMKGITGCLGYC